LTPSAIPRRYASEDRLVTLESSVGKEDGVDLRNVYRYAPPRDAAATQRDEARARFDDAVLIDCLLVGECDTAFVQDQIQSVLCDSAFIFAI